MVRAAWKGEVVSNPPCPEGVSEAYRRGWMDSCRGYDALTMQPMKDRFDYRRGWYDCGDIRFGRKENK